MIDLSSVDVLDMMFKLGIKNAHTASGGEEVNFSCFMAGHAHGDESPSAYMNVETTAWFCWGCKSRGNAISFVADVQQVSRTDAQRWLRDTYGIEFQEPQGGSMVGEIEARLKPPATAPDPTRPSPGYLSMNEVDWQCADASRADAGAIDYILERGFHRSTLEEFGAGYDHLCDRISFPVYDLDGELVGVKGRAWREDQKPKYLVYGDRGESTRFGFHPYDGSQFVYGLERQRHLDVAVVSEGELNAWAVRQAMVEHDAVIARPCAIGMSYLSPRHAQLLAREARQVFLFLDPDAAGRTCAFGRVASDGKPMPGAIELLEPLTSVYLVQGHDADPAELQRQGRSSEIIELLRAAVSSTARHLQLA